MTDGAEFLLALRTEEYDVAHRNDSVPADDPAETRSPADPLLGCPLGQEPAPAAACDSPSARRQNIVALKE